MNRCLGGIPLQPTMQRNALKADQLAGVLGEMYPDLEVHYCGNHCVRVRRADGNAVSISLMSMPLGCGWETLPLRKGDGPFNNWSVMASGNPAHVAMENAAILQVAATLRDTLTGKWDLSYWWL